MTKGIRSTTGFLASSSPWASIPSPCTKPRTNRPRRSNCSDAARSNDTQVRCHARYGSKSGETIMTENVYKVVELVGTSTDSWEKATAAAINRASKTLRDLRVAEVVKLDVQIKNGKVEAYRARISVSFKYESKG